MAAALASLYNLLSLLTLVWEVYALYNHIIPMNIWNLSMFLWMPLVILFCLIVALSPIIALFAIAKILF